jgi:hypothetical protein
VGGPACKNLETQGPFKENDLIEPWISDPTTAVAVNRVVSLVHASTVDRTKGVSP